jgi:hypothetical protein
MSRIPWIIFLVFYVVTLNGQLPASQIYQLAIIKDAQQNKRLQHLTLLTSKNPNGYNNHPHLSGDSLLFYSSAPEGTLNPDIYKLNLVNGKLIPFTKTPEGEYSAITGSNKKDIYVLRMEFWPDDTLQRIWTLPLNGQNQGKPLFVNQTNIGYFRWVFDHGMITFELGNPQTLWYRKIDGTVSTMITQLPGRCFRVTETGALYYLQKAKPGEPSFIYKTKAIYTSESPKIPIIMPLNQQEDFTVFKDGTLIMADGAKIYQFHPDKNANWELLADLSKYSLKKISRMEINELENKLVLVAQ